MQEITVIMKGKVSEKTAKKIKKIGFFAKSMDFWFDNKIIIMTIKRTYLEKFKGGK